MDTWGKIVILALAGALGIETIKEADLLHCEDRLPNYRDLHDANYVFTTSTGSGPTGVRFIHPLWDDIMPTARGQLCGATA
jgi:hypothetical protein